MTAHTNGAEDGGWAYDEVPREEFYEELSAILVDLAELIYEDPKTAPQSSNVIMSDWFFAGFGGAEDNFYVGLWPAYRPFMDGHETGEVSDAEYSRMCWPKSQGQPIMIYLGNGDDVLEIAEDDTATQELGNSFAELAGITLVDDWDAGDEDADDEGDDEE
jgi:hypothetical protein